MTGHAARAADHDNLVQLSGGHPCAAHGIVVGVFHFFVIVLCLRVEDCPCQRHVQVAHFADFVFGPVKELDARGFFGRKGDFGGLGCFVEPADRLLTIHLHRVGAVEFFKLASGPIRDGLVPVCASQMAVAAGGFGGEKTITHIDD